MAKSNCLDQCLIFALNKKLFSNEKSVKQKKIYIIWIKQNLFLLIEP